MNDQKNTPSQASGTLVERHHSPLGPILGVLVILLVVILGGLYLWGASLDQQAQVPPRAIENNEPETPRAQADAQILGTVSSSDSLAALEADIESTNLDSLDAEILEIENELNAAIVN